MKNHKEFLNYFNFLIKVLFIILIYSSSLADVNQIGFVSGINGNVVSLNEDLEERDLNELDPIFLNEEIFVAEDSTLTLQFKDNSTIIMKELTSFVVNEYINLKNNKQFISKISNGEIIVETGSIAKNKIGKMEVLAKTSSLGLRGTRMNMNLDDKKGLAVSLAEDNFGDLGQIEIISKGQKQTIFSKEQVIEISNDEIKKRDKTDEEISSEKLSSELIINNSKIDEDEIEIQLVSKLASGKITDINNDGIVNIADVEVIKNQILNSKQQKVEFIINNSKKTNTDFISGVINNSDEKNTGKTLEKIIDIKDTLIEDVVEDLTDKNNEFLVTSNLKEATLIKEKIFETIVSKETEKSAAILSKVMDKSDEKTISSIINNITIKNKNKESRLPLKVMADFAQKNSEKLTILGINNKDEIEQLTVSAVERAKSTKEDADLIANIFTNVDKEIANNIVNEVNKNSIDNKETLSAKVMESIVDKDSKKLENLNSENKKEIITKTIEVAKKQTKNELDDDSDLSSIISKIIVNTDNETALDTLENLNDQTEETETNLSLKVLINLSKEEKFEEKLETISNESDISEVIVEKMIEKAIEDIDSNKEIKIVKEIVKDNSDFLTKKIIDVNKKSKDKKIKLKIDQIIDEIVDDDPIKSKEIIEIKKEKEKEKKEIIKKKKPKKIEEIKDVFDENVSPN